MIPPPTPTPLPPGIPYVTIPEQYSIWAGTSTAIQAWNWLGDGRIVIQAILLIIIVMAALYMLYKFARIFVSESESK
jgi:membrane protein implicated in regulation of membrane protease activity